MVERKSPEASKSCLEPYDWVELLKTEAMVSVEGVVTIVLIAGLELPGSFYEMLNIVSCHDDILGNCQRRACSLVTPRARQLDTMEGMRERG